MGCARKTTVFGERTLWSEVPRCARNDVEGHSARRGGALCGADVENTLRYECRIYGSVNISAEGVK